MTSYQNPGAFIPVRLGGAGRFSLAGQSLKFVSGVFDLRLIRAAFAVVVRVVRPLIRPVRQDEAVDHYFANFGYVTPITSVVFTQVRFHTVAHATNMEHRDGKKFTHETQGLRRE